MAVPVSTVPKVVAYLVAQTLAAAKNDADADDISVTAGNPGKVESNDNIIVGGAEIQRDVAPWQLVGSGGAGWLMESYELPCIIVAFSDDSPIAVMDRAYVLLSYLETAIRTDPSLGGVVIEAYPGREVGGQPEPDDNGYSSQIQLTVFVKAQL